MTRTDALIDAVRGFEPKNDETMPHLMTLLIEPSDAAGRPIDDRLTADDLAAVRDSLRRDALAFGFGDVAALLAPETPEQVGEAA